jgi:ElaB/YqjD/DUF883 family membrane-anchored ribosome-binding protein
MDQMQIILALIAASVALTAIALIAQAFCLFGMYKVSKAIQAKVEQLMPDVQKLVETTKTTVEQSKQQILAITGKSNEILDSTKAQLAKVDSLMTDATSRAKVQMDRVEMVLDDTMSRAHETVVTVHSGVMRPLREINGIAVGIKAALHHLTNSRRSSVAQATADEEMFI